MGNSPIGNFITANTYSAPQNPVGEKLVAGTKYWNTINSAEEMYTKVTSSNGQFSLSDGVGYMASFTMKSRYKVNMQLSISVTKDSQIDLYFDGTEAILRPSPSTYGSYGKYRRYTYTVPIGTSLTSFLLKIVARTTTYTYQETTCLEWEYVLEPDGTYRRECISYGSVTRTGYAYPFVEISLNPTAGITTGVFEMVDDVETFTRHAPYSGKLTAIVRGQNFQLDTTNEKMQAQVPASARTSIQTASETNPTENRVFDVTMLLERITANFISYRDSMKSKIYERLNFSVTIFWHTYTDYRLADAAWSLIATYGFGTIEKIIA